NGSRVDAVGLGGVIWSTNDPSGEWTLEPSGVTTDLFAVDFGTAVGAAGTFLLRDEDGWFGLETGLDVDLVDYEGSYALGANGEVYQINAVDGPLELIDALVAARSLTNQFRSWAVVGDGGLASTPAGVDCD